MSVYTSIYLGLYGMGTFPQVNLGVSCELGLAGTWTDVTGWALQEGTPLTAFTITRGRGNEITSATPGTCALKLNNVDGRFSPRNPTGPYYGQLVRNTPLRISVPAAGTALRMEDDTVSSAVSSSLAVITTDIDLRAELNLSGWSTAGIMGQASWAVILNGDGTIGFNIGGGQQANSTMPLPLGHIALRITRVAASGLVTFYTSATIGGSWTQLGNTVPTPAGGFSAGSGPITVGLVFLAAGITGLVYEAQMYSGIAGTLKADAQFSAQAAGTTTWTDAQGNTWTLNGTAVISGRSYRFHGECSALPQSWDVTGHDAWTPVTAGGPLRRLQQGNTPIASVLKRGITSWQTGPSAACTSFSAPASTLAYWPAEDPQGSTQIAAGIAVNSDGNRVVPMAIAGSPAFQGTSGSPAADSVFACSAQLPQVQSSTWVGAVPAYSASASAWAVTFLLCIPSGGLPGTSFIITTCMPGFYLAVYYTTAAGGTLSLDLSGTGHVDGPTGVNGTPLLVQVSNVSTGSAPCTLSWLPLGKGVASQVGGSIGGAHLTGVQIGPHVNALGATIVGHVWATAAYSAGGVQVALPSLSLVPTPYTPVGTDLPDLFNAWNGETAGNRVARLASENGYASRIYGYPNTTQVMGPQTIDTLFNLLQSCEDADRGQLFEPRQALAIGYRTLASLTAQAAAVTLSVTADEVSPPLDTLDDDQFLRNDVTVTRSGGSAATATVTSGPLSVNSPPAGAGDYSTSLTTYVQADTQLPDIAGWMAHTGTADAERFPSVSVDLASTDGALQAILPSVRDADIGSYVTITGLSNLAWMPPGATTLLIWGSTETLGDFAWSIAWNAVPEIPYEVALSDDTVYGRADTDGSTLHANISSGATSMQADTTSASSPLWTTSAGDFPFDILMSGEQITVTNITGSSSPQTFTITRGVNGVTKAQTAGTSLALYHAPVAALI